MALTWTIVSSHSATLTPATSVANPLLPCRRLTGLCCLFFAGSFPLSTPSVFRLSTLPESKPAAFREASFKWPGKTLPSPHHALNCLASSGCCCCATGAGRVHVPARRGDELSRRYLRCRGACPSPSPDRLGCILVIWVALFSSGVSLVGQVSFTEIGQHQRPFPREMMSLRKWKRVAN